MTTVPTGCKSLHTLNKVYSLKLSTSLIDYLNENPEGEAPSTYLRSLLVADMKREIEANA